MEIFNIQNLNFKYPTYPQYTLKNLNLCITKGEFIVICGQSGSGKTTLLKQLKPSLTPHGEKSGDIFFNNQPISNLTQREEAEQIGYVLQNPDNQIVTDKVWHELAFGLENLGIEQKKIRLRVGEMVHFFGISHWFYKDVTTLSGGQKQLLNLASIMAMTPDVLLLDEPTSQLDPISAVDFLETLYKINQELGTTIILTEHRLEEIFKYVDKVIVMENGEIIQNDDPARVCSTLLQNNHPLKIFLPNSAKICFEVGLKNYPLTIKQAKSILEERLKNISTAFNIPKKNISSIKVLSINEVFFKYDKHQNDILKGINLELFEGEMYALMGGNGSGKSTLLNVICKQSKHYRGKIKYSTKKISLLPQDPQALFIGKTVQEELQNVVQNGDFNKVLEMAKLVQITPYLNTHPYDLSGGEQQRVALGKILLCNPDLLLLDEPTKGLDAQFKETFAKILQDLQNQGLTILLVSHDIEFCAKFATRCGLFFDGEIISEDTPHQFFSSNYFYTTSTNRLVREFLPFAITPDDVIKSI
ncbi:MAG: hypothetical protein ATN36_03610 [Epulopiscium sp. Nele67-Bin005]|nr:MAG: hypothetical protein ATN36_03610 [Epulopiscium sp. Nele67-Bin005]